MSKIAEKASVIPIFGDRMRKVAERMDAYVNAVTALGTARDKMSYTKFVRSKPLDLETLDALYSENDIAARVCDVVPDEELRQGYDILIAPDSDDESGQALDDASYVAADVHDAADALDLQKKFIEARVWGRVFGGGALILGADDGATAENGGLKQPLNENAIQRFDHINVIDRRYIHPLTYYTDPTSPKFGYVRTLLITPQAVDTLQAAQIAQGTVEMHESRLVIFGGTRTTIHTRQINGGWDTSVLQRMNTVLDQFGVSWQALTHLLQDASQGVFKMRGLLDALAANQTDLVMRRMDMMDMARSIVRGLVLDADGEEFTRQNYTWSGIDKVFEMLMLRLAAAARMPVTVLMGQSPAGMDATGESDIRWFYDTIRSSQTNEVKPLLERILRLIMLSKAGPTRGKVPDSWSVVFPSLWQMTPAEQAGVEKTTAEKDAIYIDRGVLTPEEVAVSRYTPDGWRSDTQINLEERRAILEGAIDLDADITPAPDAGGTEPGAGGTEDVESQALNGAQVASLVDVATKVQNGELDQTSGVYIVMTAIPSINPSTAMSIVGEMNPEKKAARDAATARLATIGNNPPTPPNTPEPPEPEPPEPEPTGNEDGRREYIYDPVEHEDVIEKRGSKWVLLSHDKSKVLGEHNTREQAEAQERAVLAAKAKRKSDATEVQTLIFDKTKFDRSAAKKWAKEHDYKSGNVEDTEDSFRLRQRDPGDFVRMRTIEFEPGIKAVVGPLKG